MTAMVREPMMWLVVGLPIAAVVAGVALIVISLRSGSVDAVIDPVERTAQMQVSRTGPGPARRAEAVGRAARRQRHGGTAAGQRRRSPATSR